MASAIHKLFLSPQQYAERRKNYLGSRLVDHPSGCTTWTGSRLATVNIWELVAWVLVSAKILGVHCTHVFIFILFFATHIRYNRVQKLNILHLYHRCCKIVHLRLEPVSLWAFSAKREIEIATVHGSAQGSHQVQMEDCYSLLDLEEDLN